MRVTAVRSREEVAYDVIASAHAHSVVEDSARCEKKEKKDKEKTEPEIARVVLPASFCKTVWQQSVPAGIPPPPSFPPPTFPPTFAPPTRSCIPDDGFIVVRRGKRKGFHR